MENIYNVIRENKQKYIDNFNETYPNGNFYLTVSIFGSEYVFDSFDDIEKAKEEMTINSWRWQSLFIVWSDGLICADEV